MASSALLAALANFERCDNELAESVWKTLLGPLEGDKKLSKNELEIHRKRLTPLAMTMINQNLVSFGKLHDRAESRNKLAEDSEMISCLIDTSFYALKALHLLNDTKTVKHLDVEKARSNLITKLINISQYERAFQELASFRAHLATLIGVSLETRQQEAKSVDIKDKSILTESINSPSTPSSPRFMKPTARQLTAELYKTVAVNKTKDSLSQHADLLYLPMQANMNNLSMVRLILANQLNAIRCIVEMNGGANIPELSDLLERKGSFFDWCHHLATIDEEKAQEQFEYLYRLLSKAAKSNHSITIPPLQVLKLRVQSLCAAYFSKRAKFGYICDQLVRIGVTFEKASNQVPTPVKFQTLQQHCEYILKFVEPAVNDLAGMDNYFILCEYYAYVSRKSGSYQGSFYAFKHMMRPLRIVLQDPQNCQSYHLMYAASAKMSLASIQLDKMISSNAYADINTTLTEISSCIEFSVTSLRNNVEMSKYTEQAMRNLCKSVDNFRNSCNAMHGFLSKKMEESITRREIEHDPYQTPPQRKHMHPDEFGEWKNNTANIFDCLIKCTELVPICIRMLSSKNTDLSLPGANTDTISLAHIDVVLLLARMVFRFDDPETHERAFQFLRKAEIFCSSNGFTEGIRWVSSTYYSFGANLATEGEYGKAIVPLEKSCAILEQDQIRAKTHSEQWSMQLCKRYELLGASHLKIFNQRKAIAALQNALRHLPKATINEFVRHCASVSLTLIVEKHPVIPKLIERYLRAAVIDAPDDEVALATEIMDLQHLSRGQQAILKECELQVMNIMSLRTNVAMFQLKLIDQLLDAYEPTLYPIRRSRILIEKCRLLATKGNTQLDSKANGMSAIQEALDLLKGDLFVKDSELLDYRRFYLSMCYSWKGVCNQHDVPVATDSFELALRCWGTIFKPIPLLGEDIPLDDEGKVAIYRQVDGVDRLYGHLRMLSDLFSVNRRQIQRLAVLRLLLQLNNGLRGSESEHISDGVMLCTEVSIAYMELGYTGKAAIEFERAARILKTGRCDIEARLNYMLVYAQYLAITGDIERSTEIYQQAKEQGDKASFLRNTSKFKSAQHKLSRSILLANASFTRSYISMELASVDDAVKDATNSLRKLSQISSSLFRKSASRSSEQPDQMGNPFNSSTKQYEANVTEEQQHNGIVQTVTDIALQDAHWGMAQKMSNCFTRLGVLHSARGSWREAEYFLKQGLKLSEQLGSNVASSTYLVYLADLYWKIDKYEDSQNNLEKALELQSMGLPFPKDQADLKIIVGDVDGSQGYNDAAMESYQDADNILANLMERAFISGLEQSLARINEGTPRTIRFLKELKEPRISHFSTESEYDCILLHSNHANVIIREALLIATSGDIKSAYAKLESLESTMPLFSNEASKLNTAVSKLKLHQTLAEIRDHKIGQHLSKNAMSLPLLKSSSSRMPIRRPTSALNLKLSRENVKQAIERLMEALSSGVDKLELQLVNNICLNMAASLFLKSLLSTNGMLTNETATLSVYYLELSKGVSFRREMQTCLSQKLRKSIAFDNEEKWPPAIYTDGNIDGEDEEMVDHWHHAHLEQLRDLYKEEHELDENGFQTKFINILPPNWTVCSLTLDPAQGDLYISRMQANTTPLLLKLPLQRFAQRNGEGEDMSYQAVTEEFNKIISESNATMHSGKTFENKTDVEKWWKTRHELDERLKHLMEKVDDNWLGGFKGILAEECKVVESILKKFQSFLSELICKAANGRSARPAISMVHKPKLLEISLDICKMILRIGQKATHKDIEDIAYYLLSLYEINDTDVNYDEVDIGQLKDDISSGIRHYHDAVKKVDQQDFPGNSQNHTILILDKYTQLLPIECLSGLKGRSVSRLPCLSFLRDRILYARSMHQINDPLSTDTASEWSDIVLDGNSAFYVLNPSGDLKKTQAEFQSALQNRTEWQGTVGQPPMEQQIQNALKQKDIYIYFGHSGGEAFIRGHVVRQVKHCAVSLLMGCSSGLMKPVGQYDPYGNVINYLLAGCPAVVANLWDVTDKSIDRFTKSMMIRWGLLAPPGNQDASQFKGSSLTEAVAHARFDCPMQYLIGAAPVVYGIPVYLQ
ncbi:hypothetical protein K450DRAFT_229931 [Umbelopsis ramanniana AG]|uniref:separase n=1 Tax=Umbelopsis ramanniana AG TaxID=1314678 RepID=A0AAD5HF03_UMBRA|nr:uncharacterized protein K450DRAFT_229931 [Umbelopsis ramanniana AG]KAI8581925.1 hypothetical protein K450DRAFT_229931 [Umbelopsis ramanniana AG]